MIEELIRIEHGLFIHEDHLFRFDLSIAEGECIGIYTDDHLTSGTAFMGIFSGGSQMKEGKAFLCGKRSQPEEVHRWIRDFCTLIGKQRFTSGELTAGDLLILPEKGRPSEQTREAEAVRDRLGITFSPEKKITRLSLPEYYRLLLYQAWLSRSRVIVLDRLSEILQGEDLEDLMQGVHFLQGKGLSFFLLDLDEEFMFRHADRIDVLRDHSLFYRLEPEEYDERLYIALGWKKRLPARRDQEAAPSLSSSPVLPPGPSSAGSPIPVLELRDLCFRGISPLSFHLYEGEIGFTREENYLTARRLTECFTQKQSWIRGRFFLCGKEYDRRSLQHLIGTEIGLQTAMPDRTGGMLFDNMTALQNLSSLLVPKAGKLFFSEKLEESILREASEWFGQESLQRPVREWSHPDRLKLTYIRWYLMNPRILICLFPFSGQESEHHEMISQLLALCAGRGMAVWIISSEIDSVLSRTGNKDFLSRLRYL